MNCPSCGGIVGRDCFNPEECAWILREMQSEMDRDRGAREQEIHDARYIDHLEHRIERMNEVLGKVRMTCEMDHELYMEIDEVMTREVRK